MDSPLFDKNRMSNAPLRVSHKKVFPEEKERFTLSNRETERVLVHTRQKKRNKKRGK